MPIINRQWFVLLIIISNLYTVFAQQTNLISILKQPVDSTHNDALIEQIYDHLSMQIGSYNQSHALELVEQRFNFKQHFLSKSNQDYRVLLPSAIYQPTPTFRPYRILFINSINITLLTKKITNSAYQCTYEYAVWDNNVLSLIDFGKHTVNFNLASDDSTVDRNEASKKLSNFLKSQWVNNINQFLKSDDTEPGYIGNPSMKPRKGPMLIIGLAAQYNGHLADKEEGDPNIPDEYEDLSEKPSLQNYYPNALSFTPHVDLLLFNHDVAVGFGYEMNIESLESNGTYLLGGGPEEPSEETLSIKSHTFTLGVYKEFQPNKFWFIKGRIMKSIYTGESKFSSITVKTHFNNSVSPGLSFGLIAGQKILFIGELGFSIASTRLSKVSSGNASLDQDFKLSDNRIFIKAGIGFNAYTGF